MKQRGGSWSEGAGDGDGEQVSVRELVPVCVRFRACVRVCYDEEQVSW